MNGVNDMYPSRTSQTKLYTFCYNTIALVYYLNDGTKRNEKKNTRKIGGVNCKN